MRDSDQMSGLTVQRTVDHGGSEGTLRDRSWFLSPEIELLLCCGGSQGHRKNRFRMSALMRNGIDWDHFLTLASWHRLLPLVYWNLSQLGSPTPPTHAMTQLHAGFLKNAHDALGMAAELIKVLQQMEDCGIVAVPYKGPALAFRLYGNVVLRPSCDLDILVRRRDVPAAREVLTSMSYAPRYLLPSSKQAFLLGSRCSERFDKDDGNIVELHWGFTNKDIAFPLTLDDLMPRLGEFRLGGATVRSLSAEDLLLVLCIHGAKHRWDRLEWISGVAELISESEDLDWEALSARARATRGYRVLLLGLALAHDTHRVRLPQSVMRQIRSDRYVGNLAEEVRSSLVYGVDQNNEDKEAAYGSLKHDLFHLKLRDRTRDRFHYLLYRLTTPSRPESWSAVLIAGRPVALHSAIRPIRVATRLPLVLWKHFASTRNHHRRTPRSHHD